LAPPTICWQLVKKYEFLTLFFFFSLSPQISHPFCVRPCSPFASFPPIAVPRTPDDLFVLSPPPCTCFLKWSLPGYSFNERRPATSLVPHCFAELGANIGFFDGACPTSYQPAPRVIRSLRLREVFLSDKTLLPLNFGFPKSVSTFFFFCCCWPSYVPDTAHARCDGQISHYAISAPKCPIPLPPNWSPRATLKVIKTAP